MKEEQDVGGEAELKNKREDGLLIPLSDKGKERGGMGIHCVSPKRADNREKGEIEEALLLHQRQHETCRDVDPASASTGAWI
jgi:hypothetical protein